MHYVFIIILMKLISVGALFHVGLLSSLEMWTVV